MQKIFELLDQMKRENYGEPMPVNPAGLLGVSPAQAAPVAMLEDMSNDPAAQGVLGVPSPERNPVRPDTLLKKFENEALTGFRKGQWFSHPSPEGGKPTLGWGHKITIDEDKRGTIKIGKQRVNFKNGLTPQQVNQLYEQDTTKARSIARKSLAKKKSAIKPNELQALTSLIYNVGEGNWSKSNAKKNLESGDITGFLKEAFDSKIGFVKANKKIFKGLVDRRAKERDLFKGVM
jgi:GH24 family phage-related lysozyme (muramidase)